MTDFSPSAWHDLRCRDRIGVGMRSANGWLILTGIGAAITLIAPEILITAGISIVGIPLAIALLFAPLVFLVSLGSVVLGKYLHGGTIGYLAGAGLTLVALAIPADLINRGLDQRAEAFVADD